MAANAGTYVQRRAAAWFAQIRKPFHRRIIWTRLCNLAVRLKSQALKSLPGRRPNCLASYVLANYARE